jgi:hypothetical protein
MLGGDPESQVSRAHARELLDSAAVESDSARAAKGDAKVPPLAGAAPSRGRRR